MVKGQCACGAVAFEVPAVRETVSFCHCGQCRQFSGHVWASTAAPLSQITFTRDEGLTWYQSSDFARRGFCNRCGSSLFYHITEKDKLGIAVGCLPDTVKLTPGKHIFVGDKPNYYDIADDAPQLETY